MRLVRNSSLCNFVNLVLEFYNRATAQQRSGVVSATGIATGTTVGDAWALRSRRPEWKKVLGTKKVIQVSQYLYDIYL